MSAAAIPRQNVHYNLIRSGLIDPYSMAILTVINSYSGFCAPKRIADLARMAKMSERKARHCINFLVQQGIITKQYRCYKRVTLRISSLKTQAAKFSLKLKEFTMSSYRHGKPRYDRHGTTEPIQKSTLKNKTEEIVNEKIENRSKENEISWLELRKSLFSKRPAHAGTIFGSKN